MKPLLRYVGKLTLTPSRMIPADAEAVFQAGWDERALHDAVSVCALFNLMNRLVDGLGIQAGEDYFSWPRSGSPITATRACSRTPQRVPGRIAPLTVMAPTQTKPDPGPRIRRDHRRGRAVGTVHSCRSASSTPRTNVGYG
jgi:hypothetical protein